MNIGLFFGSFNPVHIGHLIIANYMLDNTAAEQVWLVVTPHNPLKKWEELLDDDKRLAMVRIAIEDRDNILACDVEFGLPRPSYTIQTLEFLGEQYPACRFSLIMGSDNLSIFGQWKRAKDILDNHELWIYKRPGYFSEHEVSHPHVRIFEAPLLSISSTYIRSCIFGKKSIRYLVPDPVRKYIEENRLYQ